MDNEWFAVDGEGRLGFFWSCESGAVPKAVTGQRQGRDLVEAIFLRTPAAMIGAAGKHLVESGAEVTRVMTFTRPELPGLRSLFGRLLGRGGEARPLFAEGQQGYWFNVGMLLRTTGLLDVLKRPPKVVGPPISAPGGTMVPAWFWMLDEDDYHTLHVVGACVGCEGDARARYATFGLHVYSAHWQGREEPNPFPGSGMVRPYRRLAAPDYPLLLDQLPQDLQAAAATVRLEGVRFAEAELVHPIEHVPCHV